MLKRIAAGAGALALGASVALASPASADPKRGDALPLSCGASTITVALNGNGQWTPGHDIANTNTYQPVAFGPVHIKVYDPESHDLIDEFTDDEGAGAKPIASNAKQSLLECTFESSFTEFADDYDQIVTAVIEGSVTIRTKK